MTKSAASPTAPRLHWVKPPQQERSKKTLERVLDAAEEVIKERGVSGLTVSEAVRRAGSSVGAFYARFADKEGLLSTLHERSCSEALATAELALDPIRCQDADIGSVVDEVVRFSAVQCQERLGLVLAFIALAATDVGYAERRAILEKKVGDLLAALLVARRDEITHPNPRLAASVVVRMVLNTFEYDAMVHRATSTGGARPDEELARELSRAVVAYIGAPVSGGRRLLDTR